MYCSETYCRWGRLPEKATALWRTREHFEQRALFPEKVKLTHALSESRLLRLPFHKQECNSGSTPPGQFYTASSPHCKWATKLYPEIFLPFNGNSTARITMISIPWSRFHKAVFRKSTGTNMNSSSCKLPVGEWALDHRTGALDSPTQLDNNQSSSFFFSVTLKTLLA